MTKSIEVKLTIEVPDSATDQDITDWVDVELCGWNSMKSDNPCIAEAEVVEGDWNTMEPTVSNMKDSVTLNTEDFYEIIRQAYLVGRKDEEDHYPIDTAGMLSYRLNRLCNDLHIQIAEGMLPNKSNA